MKLFYLQNNAYSQVMLLYPDHAEWFTMDGSDEFPIIDSRYIDGHPEYEKYRGAYGTNGGQSHTDLPAIEKAAEDYLDSIKISVMNWNWYDTVSEYEYDEDEDEFIARILGGEEILAELEI